MVKEYSSSKITTRGSPTVNDLFSAQYAKKRPFLFTVWWKKFPF